jgi:hypothetical protein
MHQQAAKLFQQQWRHLIGNYYLNSAIRKKKCTGSSFKYIAPLTLQANLYWHLTQEICFFNANQRSLKKFQNQLRPYLGKDLTIHCQQKSYGIHLVIQLL